MEPSYPCEFLVQDARLQAGRGEEFSASRLREEREKELIVGEDYHLPIGYRVNDTLDTEGLQMASVGVAIPENNKGYQMLLRMGWQGKGLGKSEDGIVEPIRSGVEPGLRLGLGKQEEIEKFTNAENVQRKKLEVEIQAEESEERTRKREMRVEQQQRIQQDVQEIKKTFYCEVCHKQYKSAMEMETHLGSYDHHHKKRLVEMKAMTAERTKRDRERREKRREEKEMAKLMAQVSRAQNQSEAAPPLPDAAPPPPPPGPPLPPDNPIPPPPPPSGWQYSSTENVEQHSAGGWAAPAPPTSWQSHGSHDTGGGTAARGWVGGPPPGATAAKGAAGAMTHPTGGAQRTTAAAVTGFKLGAGPKKLGGIALAGKAKLAKPAAAIFAEDSSEEE